jgi:hypothetical protein
MKISFTGWLGGVGFRAGAYAAWGGPAFVCSPAWLPGASQLRQMSARQPAMTHGEAFMVFLLLRLAKASLLQYKT